MTCRHKIQWGRCPFYPNKIKWKCNEMVAISRPIYLSLYLGALEYLHRTMDPVEGNNQSENGSRTHNNQKDEHSRSGQLAVFEAFSQNDLMADFIVINTGEDVVQKILSFFQNGLRAGLILSAFGSVVSPILDSDGVTTSYEGSYAIIKLEGKYSYASDGRVEQAGKIHVLLGDSNANTFGGLVDSLIAHTPVQVVVGWLIN